MTTNFYVLHLIQTWYFLSDQNPPVRTAFSVCIVYTKLKLPTHTHFNHYLSNIIPYSIKCYIQNRALYLPYKSELRIYLVINR